jgi:ketosteroid isomerase-like protein
VRELDFGLGRRRGAADPDGADDQPTVVLAKRAGVHRAILTPMDSLDEQLIREAIAAWNRRDWEAALERIDADVEWRGATELLDLAEVSRGHEGVREFWRRWTESWTDIRAEVEEFVPVDGGTLALVRWRASSPAGLEVDQPVAFHFEIRDHMVTRFVSYWERSQAFKALGLPTPG